MSPQLIVPVIVLAPLVGAIIAGLFGRRIGDVASMSVTTGLLFLSCALGWLTFFNTVYGSWHFTHEIAPFIDVMEATHEGNGPDTAPKVTASQLITEHGGAEATDTKYKDKPITITSAFVDSKDGEAALLVVGASKKGMTKIKVTLPFDARKQIATMKPGDPIKTIKGEYSSSSDGVIYINRAWIVP